MGEICSEISQYLAEVHVDSADETNGDAETSNILRATANPARDQLSVSSMFSMMHFDDLIKDVDAIRAEANARSILDVAKFFAHSHDIE